MDSIYDRVRLRLAKYRLRRDIAKLCGEAVTQRPDGGLSVDPHKIIVSHRDGQAALEHLRQLRRGTPNE